MADLKAQLGAVFDASGVKEGVGEAKRSLADLGVAAATEGRKTAEGMAAVDKASSRTAARVDADTRNLVSSIQRRTAAEEAGARGTRQFYEALARQRGVSLDTLKPYLDQLDSVSTKSAAAVAANAATTGSLGRVQVSAAQTAAALRGVPAQFTDIVTSLQGGQSPLTVLFQQGGQLKDMFGGIGPAAQALAGYIGSLVTPFTLAAGAAGVLAFAYYQATQRTLEFNKAIITSGNYAGETAGGLDTLARSISSTIGTQGQAADALTALVGTGRIAGESLREVGAAVVAQNKVMGTSVKDAVAEFVRLGEEPTKASAKLNESLHYLNLETLERIRMLENQGRQEEAAALAQSTYANATLTRMQQVQAQSGLLARALSGVKDVASGMWQAVAGGLASIGAQQSAAERLVDAQRKLAFLQQNGSTPEALKRAQQEVLDASRTSIREADNAAAEGQRARDALAKQEAAQRLADQKKATRDRAQQRKDEIEQLDRDAKLVGITEKDYAQRLAAINEKFKDPKAARAKEFQDDSGTKMLQNLREAEASLKEQLSSSEKITGAEKERAKFVQQIADLSGKRQLTAEQKSLLASQDAIKAQLDINVALEKQLETKKAAAKLDEEAKRHAQEFAQQINAINLSIAASADSRGQQYDRSLSAFGLGDRARQEVEAQKQIRSEFQRYMLQLNKDAAEKNQLGSDAYKAEVERIKSSLDEALGAQQRYFDALREKQADWRNGATTALANYVDEVDNASRRTQELVSGGLNAIDDGLTGAILDRSGDSAKRLGDNIGRQILKGIIQQQITKPIAEWLQGGLEQDGSFQSFMGKLLGGLSSTRDTGESWLGGLLGKGSSKGSDPLGDFLKSKGLLGDAGNVAANTTLATSATAASTAVAALGAAAAAAAASMAGSSLSGALNAANAIGGSGGDSLGSLIGLMGWADGGYTGPGGKYEPRGVVHANEGILNQDEVNAIGGEQGFNSLRRLIRRGPASSGYVGLLTNGGGGSATSGGGRAIAVNQAFYLNQPASRETQSQVAQRAGQATSEALRRNS